jgi:hypothetical protein
MDIREVLDAGPPLIWRVGKIASVDKSRHVADVVLGQVNDPQAPMIRQATYMTSYGRTPLIGDTVHVIVKSDMGALILGTVTP